MLYLESIEQNRLDKHGHLTVTIGNDGHYNQLLGSQPLDKTNVSRVEH